MKDWGCGHATLGLGLRIASWWLNFNPSEKYARQIGSSSPRDRNENNKYLSCHQLDSFHKSFLDDMSSDISGC